MVPLLDLPTETLTEIARLTGWSLAFRLSCKQVSRCFAGPAYNYDTCIPRLCAQFLRIHPTAAWDRDFPPPAQTFVEDLGDSRPWMQINHRWTATAEPYDGTQQIFFDFNDLDYEDNAITAMRLDIGNVHLIYSIELRRGCSSWRYSFEEPMNTAVCDDGNSIPLFPLEMPLLLGYMKSLPVGISIVVRDITPRQFPQVGLRVQLAKLKVPWKPDLSVTYLTMRNDYTPRPYVFGWALKLPFNRRDLVHDVFFGCLSEEFPTVRLKMSDLRDRRQDFPYPLVDNTVEWIFIPPVHYGNQTSMYMPFWHEWFVGYTYFDPATHGMREEIFSREEIYMLRPSVFTFRNGNRRVSLWQDNSYVEI